MELTGSSMTERMMMEGLGWMMGGCNMNDEEEYI